jgi:hypothetical protein
MGAGSGEEIIVVRSLTESDLGLFAVHRPHIASKQRAINVNAPIARRLLSPKLFAQGGTDLDCLCVFGSMKLLEPRYFGKIGKNWRLGGNQIEGDLFRQLDSKDFVLIRCFEHNDGTRPICVTFVSKKTDQVVHAGIAALVERSLKFSMVVYSAEDVGFSALARYCPTELLSSARKRGRLRGRRRMVTR